MARLWLLLMDTVLDMEELCDQDTCTPADRPQNKPITPRESVAIHRLPYNRLLASQGGYRRSKTHDNYLPQHSPQCHGLSTMPITAHLFLTRDFQALDDDDVFICSCRNTK
jgi:hypothetical protein